MQLANDNARIYPDSSGAVSPSRLWLTATAGVLCPTGTGASRCQAVWEQGLHCTASLIIPESHFNSKAPDADPA